MELDPVSTDILVFSKGLIKHALGRGQPSFRTLEEQQRMADEIEEKFQARH